MTAPDVSEEASGKRLAVARSISCLMLGIVMSGGQPAQAQRDRKLCQLQHSRVSLEKEFKIQGEGYPNLSAGNNW